MKTEKFVGKMVINVVKVIAINTVMLYLMETVDKVKSNRSK